MNYTIINRNFQERKTLKQNSMNRFQRFIKRIGGEDKVLHFETCCLITMVVALLGMNVLGLGIAASAVSACLIAVIAGILKEATTIIHTACLTTRIL